MRQILHQQMVFENENPAFLNDAGEAQYNRYVVNDAGRVGKVQGE